MMELGHSFWIECSHILPDPLGVPVMHGHSYQITVFIPTSAENPYPLDRISGLIGMMRRGIDHKHLNDVMETPTMECIAEWVYTNLQCEVRPTRVIVSRPSIGACVEFLPEASTAAFWRSKNDYSQAEIRHMKKGLAQAWRRVELCNERLRKNGLPEVWTDMTSERGLADK